MRKWNWVRCGLAAVVMVVVSGCSVKQWTVERDDGTKEHHTLVQSRPAGLYELKEVVTSFDRSVEIDPVTFAAKSVEDLIEWGKGIVGLFVPAVS